MQFHQGSFVIAYHTWLCMIDRNNKKKKEKYSSQTMLAASEMLIFIFFFNMSRSEHSENINLFRNALGTVG